MRGSVRLEDMPVRSWLAERERVVRHRLMSAEFAVVELKHELMLARHALAETSEDTDG